MAKDRQKNLRPDQWRIEHSGVVLSKTHDKERCLAEGFPCCLHNMSNHHMRAWPQEWRQDRALMERICPEHGTGHPDPDHMSWYTRTYGEEKAYYEGLHGCCGCCHTG